MITTYFKRTLEYLIDNFRRETKRHFSLSFTFALVSGAGAALLATIHTLLAEWMIGNIRLSSFLDDVREILSYHTSKIYSLTFALSILCIGLYGSFVISCINDARLTDKQKYTWADLRSFISGEEWRWFWKLIGVILVVFFVTFLSLKSLFVANPAMPPSSMAILHPDLPESGLTTLQLLPTRLLIWFDSIIALFKVYLPYLLSVFFIITVYENRLDRDVLRKYKQGIWTSLILALVIQSLGGVLRGYFDTYIVGFIQVFFSSAMTMILPLLIQLTMALIMAAVLNWTIAAALCFPIKLVYEEQNPTP